MRADDFCQRTTGPNRYTQNNQITVFDTGRRILRNSVGHVQGADPFADMRIRINGCDGMGQIHPLDAAGQRGADQTESDQADTLKQRGLKWGSQLIRHGP